MCVLYVHFSKDWEHCLDYSDESKMDLFVYESVGGTPCKPDNGFYVGKKWLNTTVSMWLEDRRKGHLVLSEFYEDPNYPDWWLDKIFNIKVY